MKKKKTRKKIRTRNPYAFSLGKLQYRKRIVLSKRRDAKPNLGMEE